jgi:hypothetical protein
MEVFSTRIVFIPASSAISASGFFLTAPPLPEIADRGESY